MLCAQGTTIRHRRIPSRLAFPTRRSSRQPRRSSATHRCSAVTVGDSVGIYRDGAGVIHGSCGELFATRSGLAAARLLTGALDGGQDLVLRRTQDPSEGPHHRGVRSPRPDPAVQRRQLGMGGSPARIADTLALFGAFLAACVVALMAWWARDQVGAGTPPRRLICAPAAGPVPGCRKRCVPASPDVPGAVP
jgi:hypothetical protein